jgi:hypothetical protein
MHYSHKHWSDGDESDVEKRVHQNLRKIGKSHKLSSKITSDFQSHNSHKEQHNETISRYHHHHYRTGHIYPHIHHYSHKVEEFAFHNRRINTLPHGTEIFFILKCCNCCHIFSNVKLLEF